LGAGQRVGAAFASTDGARWQRTTAQSTFSEIPAYMVATSTRLIALANRPSPPASVVAWVSLDGRGWQHEPDLALAGVIVSQVAVRDGVILALGTDASGRVAMWRSDDGGRWTQTPASPAGIVRGIAAVNDGFLALGRDGAPDVGSGGVCSRSVLKNRERIRTRSRVAALPLEEDRDAVTWAKAGRGDRVSRRLEPCVCVRFDEYGIAGLAGGSGIL